MITKLIILADVTSPTETYKQSIQIISILLFCHLLCEALQDSESVKIYNIEAFQDLLYSLLIFLFSYLPSKVILFEMNSHIKQKPIF